MAQGARTPEERLAAAKVFIAAAMADGIIDMPTATALRRYAQSAYEAATLPARTAVPASTAPPTHVSPRTTEPTPTPSSPGPARSFPAPAPPVSPRQASPPLPEIPEPGRQIEPPIETAPTWTERFDAGFGRGWSRLSADFAANSLIYVGVLLSVVVIFVFFAFGYFGEAVENPGLRSPIFLAAPVVFFGLAWVLRNKTGVPAAANAVGLIGALILPIMLSALFQDDSSWSHYWGEEAQTPAREAQAGSIARFFPLSWVPNLDGSDRWVGYAIVGILCAGIYYLMARRQRIYAYGVAPMAWATVGALGLYWSTGMSGPQMLMVLAAIGVGLAMAIAWRETTIGRTIAFQTVRIGVVTAPIAFSFALLFAYNDAIERGVASPSLSDLAYPGSAAAGLLAAVLAISSATGFAWQNLGERTRQATLTALRIAAYVSAGIAVVLALSYEATPGWIGVALVAFGVGVAAVDGVLGGSGTAPTWIARASIVIGAALAITTPWPTIVVWASFLIIAVARSAFSPIREITGSLLPYREDPSAALVELWIPAFVLVGAGVARIVDPLAITWVFIGAAAVAVGTQVLPSGFTSLRSFSSFPAALFAAAAAATALYQQAVSSPYAPGEIGLGLLALGAIGALLTFPWMIRLPIVVAALDGAAISFVIELVDPGAAGISITVASVLAASGALLVTASFLPALRPWMTPHALAGHGLLYLALLPSGTSDQAALVALGAIIAAHGIEAYLVDRSGVPSIEAAVERSTDNQGLRNGPGIVTALATPAFVVLACAQFAWFDVSAARLGIPLAVLALGYSLLAFAIDREAVRWTFISLAYVGVAVSIALSAAERDGIVSAIALSLGAISAALLSVRLREAAASLLAWISAYAAIAVWVGELGWLPVDWLYIPVLSTALGVTIACIALKRLLDPEIGLGPWIATAVTTSMVVTAIAMGQAIATDMWLWAWAAGSAVVTLVVALVYRLSGLTMLCWAYTAIAYADVLQDRIESDAVWLLPLAALAVAIAALLPGRRSTDMADPSVLTLDFAFLTMVVAVAWALSGGQPAATLAWSSTLLATTGVVRAEEIWFHGGVVLAVWSGAAAGEGWLPLGLAITAVVETVVAIVRREHPSGVVLPWIATTLWAAAAAATVDWLDIEASGIVALGLAAGSLLSTGAVLAWLYLPDEPGVARWTSPIGIVGQAALAGAAFQAWHAFGDGAAALTWAAVAFVEAMLVGYPATVRVSRPGAWLSALFIGAGGALALRALDLIWLEAVWATAFIGGALLTAWIVAALVVHQERVALWQTPMAALGQIAFVASGVAAWLGLPFTDAQLTWWVLLTVDAAAIALVATLAARAWMAAVSVAMVLVAAQLVMTWLDLGTTIAWIWLAALAVFEVGATLATRARSRPPAGTWFVPLHGSVALAAVATLLSGWLLLAPRDAMLLAAAVAATVGAYFIANRSWMGEGGEAEVLGAVSFVTSAGLVAISLGPDDWWAMPVLLAMAGAGIAMAGAAGATDGWSGTAWGTAGSGFSTIALFGVLVLFPPISAEFGWVLIMIGAALAAYAITARQPLFLHLAVATWLVGLLVLIDYQWSLELLATVTTVSAVLLAMMDVERHRRQRLDMQRPGWMRISEWVLMLLPMVLAAREMATDSLMYGLLLGAEGAVLLGWGILSEVRRRAVAGLAGVTTAVLMVVMVPLVRGVGGALSGGWWLVLGGLAAAVFITAGSMLEKYRTRIGDRLTRTTEILERWE